MQGPLELCSLIMITMAMILSRVLYSAIVFDCNLGHIYFAFFGVKIYLYTDLRALIPWWIVGLSFCLVRRKNFTFLYLEWISKSDFNFIFFDSPSFGYTHTVISTIEISHPRKWWEALFAKNRLHVFIPCLHTDDSTFRLESFWAFIVVLSYFKALWDILSPFYLLWITLIPFESHWSQSMSR